MARWTQDKLIGIGTLDEVSIASLRRDGTLRSPRTVWVVRDGDDLYVRSVYGPGSAWYRGTRTRHEGEVRAGGMVQAVTFVDANADIDARLNNNIDADYRSKYASYAASILDSITSEEARSTTLRLVPR